MTRHDDIFAGILVGGRGKRLGAVDKARLTVEGTTLLRRTASVLDGAVVEIRLSGRAGQTYDGVTVVPDRTADSGPLGGLDALLASAPAEWCYLVSCDLPHLTGDVLDMLAGARDGRALIVVPRTEDRLHPTCALYHRSLAESVRSHVARGRLSMQKFVAAAPHRIVDAEDPVPFFNLNTPADLDAL